MDINKFDVIVWVRETDSFRELRDQLLRLAGNEPDETTSYEGMVDFHWASLISLTPSTWPLPSAQWCPGPMSYFCDSAITIT